MMMATVKIEPVVDDEESARLLDEPKLADQKTSTGLSRKFWIWVIVNTIATAAIVFVNKRIFENESLRHAQVAFAAFHFAVTAALLYLVSRPWINAFEAKKVAMVQVLPLATAMIFNVVLPNASLAYSSIQFYQLVRVLLSPCVAYLNYILYGHTVPTLAALTLIPVCAGVGVVSYFDATTKTDATARGTSPLGIIFAFTGLFASAIYNVWISRYHKVLGCSSPQLLLNQAPLSVLLMLYIIPFSDDVTVCSTTPGPVWMLILSSGVLACFINVSQFFIIHEAGPVSSTIVGHFKTCIIVGTGWVYSGMSVKDGSLVGIALALGGIVTYSVAVLKQTRK